MMNKDSFSVVHSNFHVALRSDPVVTVFLSAFSSRFTRLIISDSCSGVVANPRSVPSMSDKSVSRAAGLVGFFEVNKFMKARVFSCCRRIRLQSTAKLPCRADTGLSACSGIVIRLPGILKLVQLSQEWDSLYLKVTRKVQMTF